MSDRPRRADARRNYELLVAAARAAVAEHGHGVALDEIARRAGVGNATLYRHFPSRHELLVAVHSADVDDLVARGRELLAADEGGALRAWLRVLVRHVAARRGLAAAALRTAGEPTNPACTWHEDLRAVAAELLDDARSHGAARADVRPDELLAYVNAVAGACEEGRHDGERLLDLLFDGIVPRAT